MAHFAKISEDNIVLTVVPVDDENILNEGVVDEGLGQQYLQTHCNWPAHLWILTDKGTLNNQKENGTRFRGNYAGINNTWDPDNEIFWKIKPYASWVKHIATASWKSPLGDAPDLTDAQNAENTTGTHFWEYFWDEDAYQADNTTGWILKNYKANIDD